eukprot:TRINITY_DN11060_c0_g3_i1.p1 TRINITY_DN11060_c0_g3~~TRINITY_DN11060_c0_g3_i1.p1  ORF type:complete len:486 (+),score=126.43 TRINITY_DN11060_c0_g3_i1:57-1460(+)
MKSITVILILLAISFAAVMSRRHLDDSNNNQVDTVTSVKTSEEKKDTPDSPQQSKPKQQQQQQKQPKQKENKAVATPNPTPAPTTATVNPTPSPPVLSPEEQKMYNYHQCVDAIMRDGNMSDCPKHPVKPERLLLLVGDSTAREFAKGIDKRFRVEPFTLGKRNVKLLTHDPPAKTYEDGIVVTTRIVLIGLCKIYDIREQLLSSLDKFVEKFGKPDVVYFTTGGLHDCMWPWRNEDPLYDMVMKRKIPDTYSKDWLNRKTMKNPPIVSVGVKDYVDIQSPCFMETIRKMRLQIPDAIMVWRPFINVKDLRSGGNVKQQLYTPEFCERNALWNDFRLQTCGTVFEKHKKYAKTIADMGIAVIDNKAYYPEHCTSTDSMHLHYDCQRIISSFIGDIQRLGPQIIPKGMKANEKAMCSMKYFKEKVKKVKALPKNKRPIKEDLDGSIEQCLSIHNETEKLKWDKNFHRI